jgi:acyl-[acyl-carrier-protein]-phospholipid O-acyltransferase/long-chain-fatty-acid--[acyl-carrier-protein] ligase
VIASSLGAFNDNAWKQVVVLLAADAAASFEASMRQAALAQVILLVPLILFNLPGGALADRLSKRTVILDLKAVEVILMILGTIVLFAIPSGGWPAMAVLGLLGIQAALFSPSKYGILPEILPHERLSSGNGLLEMWTNLAIIGGTVAAGMILFLAGGRSWLGGLALTGSALGGLLAALTIPRVRAARPQGLLGETLGMGWSAIRSDRVLRLSITGQVVVWTVASLIPAAVLTHAIRTLELPKWETGFPLAAIGVGIGIGSVAAGRLSGAKVEYGLVPLGAIGLTLGTLLFGLFTPGFGLTMVLMTLIGTAAGLVFVPLNALIQWRAPEDRRGSVIAVANMLVNGGMLAGSLLAFVLATAGFRAGGVFLGAAAVLGLGTIWALWLLPDAFLRFILILAAGTFYRLRVFGRSNVPQDGPALLTPNHISFADGLFLIATIDRPIRFVVYAAYFNRPLIGRFLRTMKAIPIARDGGPKMILEAFREAGRALDAGELVCIFPEGQLTRTGMTLPFQRGVERIVKGRDVPIIPVHLDRVTASIFSPMQRRWVPERIPLPITISFGKPLHSPTSASVIRQAIAELDQEAWEQRKPDRRPLHHEFIRRARRHSLRMALVDAITPELSFIKALAGSVVLARALRERWEGQDAVGILLPASVAGVLANLAAALSGRIAVNLNFTAGKAALSSASAQAGLRTVITSRAFIDKAALDLPEGVEVIWLEDLKNTISRADRARALAIACLAPVRLLERACGARRRTSVDDVSALIFSSGSEGEPKGVVLTHFNIDSQIEAIAQVFKMYPTDRILDILPMFHSYGYLLLWLGLCRGMGLVCHVKPQESGTVGVLVERYAATVLFATPTFLNIYLRRCGPPQFGSLRLVIAGAEKLPDSISNAFEDTFGIRPLEGYGMTECSPVVAVNAPDFRAPGFYQPGHRRGTVGHPLPGVAVRIVTPEGIVDQTSLKGLDQVEPLSVGTEGLILVKGPNVMRGYLNREDLTRKAICDGWYVTGDLGRLDEDGFLTITGRFSRFSKIGGEMVPHGRIEEALNEAAATDEPAFAVTAVPDGRGGDRLAVLHTVNEEQADQALAKLSAMGLPNLFLPRRDHFVKVDELPILGTGKLDLRALKSIATERLRGEQPDSQPQDAVAVCEVRPTPRLRESDLPSETAR